VIEHTVKFGVGIDPTGNVILPVGFELPDINGILTDAPFPEPLDFVMFEQVAFLAVIPRNSGKTLELATLNDSAEYIAHGDFSAINDFNANI
jgi:hypothetical protein